MKNRFLAVFMVTMVLFNAIGTGLMAFAGDGSSHDSDEWALIESVILKNGSTELSSGDSVSFSDGLSVSYIFKSGIVISSSTDGYDDDAIVIQSGRTYNLPDIDVSDISLSGSLSSSVDVQNEDGLLHVGEIAVDTDGNVTFEVEPGIEDDTELAIEDFVVTFTLDEEKIGNATSYDLTIGDQTYTFSISDNSSETPSMTTGAEVPDGSETVTWTTTITNADNPVDYSENGYTFEGVLDAGQVLDEDSIAVAVGGTPLTIDNDRLTVAEDSDGNTTITYVLNGDEVDTTPGGETVITYDADVDFLGNGGAAKALKNKTVTNDVRIAESASADDAIASANGEATVLPAKNIASLSKAINNVNGKFTKNSSDQGVGEWSITVDTNDYDLRNLIVYDYMILGENSGNYEFSLDESSVAVSKNGAAMDAADYTLVTTPGDGYTWSVKFDSAAAGDEFVITYRTLLSNYTDYLRTNHSKAPYNTAFMTYEYEKGSGSGNWVEVQGPSMKVGSTITTNAGISVSTGKSSKYDPATHRITWTVTVNREKQRLTGARILESVPADQTYVSSDINEVVSEAEITENGNIITFDIGNAADEETVTFKVVTELKTSQANVWSKNTNKVYYDPFTLYANELGAEGITIKGDCTYYSEVIDLTAGDYNYDTHEIGYTVEVNDNLMLMTGVSIADDLGSAGLELVEGSVKLNGDELSPADASGPGYAYTDGKLIVYADDVESSEVGTADAKSVITFSAKVTNHTLLDTAVKSKTVSIENTADLYTDTASIIHTLSEDEDLITESDSATTDFTNTVVLKTATIDEDNLSADYVVTFNANQIRLPANLLITDTLGSSMDLDVSSVKLYIGTVDAATGEVTSSGTEESGYTVSTKINDAGRTVLTIRLAEEEDNTNAYYITYSATAVDLSAKDFGNTVSISGYTGESITDVNLDANVLSTVGGKASKLAKIVITNVDREDHNVTLSNSTFVIRDQAGNLVRTVVTKADGTAKAIGGKIKNNTTYVVTQLQVHDGYVLETEPFEVAVSNNAAAYTFENSKPAMNITISKEDGADNFVAGAGLKITRKDSTDNTVNADSWVSAADAAHLFEASYDTVYTLTETSVPFGYDQASDIRFKVVDGILYRYAEDEWTQADSIVMIDRPLASAGFSVSKVSAGQGHALSGAELLISERDSLEEAKADYVAKWTTDGAAKEFALPAGTYYLYETSAPTGYTKADRIAFRIVEGAEGLVLQLADENGDFADAESDLIVMTDEHNAEETYTVTFSPESLGMDPKVFSQLDFELFTIDPDTKQLVRVEPEAPAAPEAKDELTYKINYQDEYTLIPTATAKGYKPVPPVTIKVVDDTIYTETQASDTFSPVSLEQLGELMTPAPAPAPANPGRTSGGSGRETSKEPNPLPGTPQIPGTPGIPGTPADPANGDTSIEISSTDTTQNPENAANTENVENTEITGAVENAENTASPSPSGSGSNVDSGSGNATAAGETEKNTDETAAGQTADGSSAEKSTGKTLAKTGGFIGTLMAYIAAVIAIFTGVFLVFGKRRTEY